VKRGYAPRHVYSIAYIPHRVSGRVRDVRADDDTLRDRNRLGEEKEVEEGDGREGGHENQDELVREKEELEGGNTLEGPSYTVVARGRGSSGWSVCHVNVISGLTLSADLRCHSQLIEVLGSDVRQEKADRQLYRRHLHKIHQLKAARSRVRS
jgi:hypothetical protein